MANDGCDFEGSCLVLKNHSPDELKKAQPRIIGKIPGEDGCFSLKRVAELKCLISSQSAFPKLTDTYRLTGVF